MKNIIIIHYIFGKDWQNLTLGNRNIIILELCKLDRFVELRLMYCVKQYAISKIMIC